MLRKRDHLHRRPIRWYLTAPHWRELYAWLIAGLLLDTVIGFGGDGFDAGSIWHMGVACIVLAAVRTGLVRWVAFLTRQD